MYRIFICATEQSGDNIGYNIMLQLLNANKKITFDGVGGHKMSTIFNNQIYNLNDFNAMGIFEIFFSIKKYIKMIRVISNKILCSNYDLILTIDSPDFNYPMVKRLRNKKYNKKIIHLVAPTVWAWRSYRAKKFSKIFDELFVLFNFEIIFFEKYGLKTTLMGHPIYYINSNNYTGNFNTIAFLPGSRLSEVNKLIPYFKLAYDYLLINYPNITIFIPTLPHLEKNIKCFVSEWKIKIIVSSDTKIIEENYKKTSKALVCSGTASLEIAKRNIPQLVIYKLNFFTEFFGKIFIKVKFANIINIIENFNVIPEITNSNLNHKNFLTEFKNLINNNKANKIQINNINKSLNSLKVNEPPYKLVSKKIINYIN